MTRTFDIDVLIVGLGPAGSSAATAAAKAGARVIAIDRKKEAGVPVQCAELVPAMVGAPAEALTLARRQSIAAMTTFVESDAPHLKDNFPGHMIDRARFDAALVAEAQAESAQCWLGVALRTLDADGTAHLSDGSELRARVVIGADGPHSPVGHAIGHENSALAETRQMTVPLLEPFAETDIFLAARCPGGYAWLFPKGDVANLGIGVAPQWRERLKPLLDDLHAQLAEAGRVGRQPIAYTGGAIPVGGLVDPVTQLGETLVMLAGDAAGLANPITGAGINPALISGRLAGAAAAAHVAGVAGAGHDYAEELQDTFGPSLARALARRRELMALYDRGAEPDADALRRAWIAFPDYWAA